MNIFDIYTAGGEEALVAPKKKRFEFKFGAGRGFGITLNRLTHIEYGTMERGWTIDGVVDQKARVEQLADKVVLDVDGLINRADGRPIVADREFKIQILTEVPELFLFVLRNMGNSEAFRKKDDSGPASSTGGESPASSGPSANA